MRRLLLSVAALLPLAVFAGCHHEAGKCDCVRNMGIDCPCYGHSLAAPPVAVTAPPVKAPEPLKDTPKPKSDLPDK